MNNAVFRKTMVNARYQPCNNLKKKGLFSIRTKLSYREAIEMKKHKYT